MYLQGHNAKAHHPYMVDVSDAKLHATEVRASEEQSAHWGPQGAHASDEHVALEADAG